MSAAGLWIVVTGPGDGAFASAPAVDPAVDVAAGAGRRPTPTWPAPSALFGAGKLPDALAVLDRDLARRQRLSATRRRCAARVQRELLAAASGVAVERSQP